MQGVLMKLHQADGTLFTSENWQPFFFSLKNQILTFSDENDKIKTRGCLHMAISKLLPEMRTDSDCDIRIYSGLVELRLRAYSIKDKVDWCNAINRSQRQNEFMSKN